jgi:hypothetical protein
MESLAGSGGAADLAVRVDLPAAVAVVPCVDRAQEVAALGAALRRWRLAGMPAPAVAVVSARAEVARNLLAAADPDAAPVRVGALGDADLAALQALALVGCDHALFAAPDGMFDDPDALHPRDRARAVHRACAAPRRDLLITWRGRPDALFTALAEG